MVRVDVKNPGYDWRRKSITMNDEKAVNAYTVMWWVEIMAHRISWEYNIKYEE